jgi:cytochrome c biogenesis factor
MKTQEKLVHAFILFVSVSTVLVLCGTAAPIVFQLFQFNVDDVSFTCGAPFFNGIFIPQVVCIMILMVYMHIREYTFWVLLWIVCLGLVQFSVIYYLAGFSLTESIYCVHIFIICVDVFSHTT